MKIVPAFILSSVFVSLVFACSAPETAGTDSSNVTEKKEKTDPEDKPAAKTDAGASSSSGGEGTGGKSEAEVKQCLTTCWAGTPSSAYGSCSMKCEDEKCDETCWTQNCGGSKEEQCMTDSDKCFSQCVPEQKLNDTQIQCISTCAQGGVAKAYDTCAKSCQDADCDEKCFTDNCSGKEEQCDSAMDACFTQCVKE